MLRYLGWTEAADLIIKHREGAISVCQATYDFERLTREEGPGAPGVKLLKCSEFGQTVIHHTA